MEKIKLLFNKLKDNFYKRYIFLIIFFVVVLIFGSFSKNASYIKNYGSEQKLLLNDKKLVQDIELENTNISQIKFTVGKNNPYKGAKYKINVLDGEISVGSVNINTKDIKDKQDILIGIAEGKTNNKILRVEIEGTCESDDDGLYVYSFDDSNGAITVDGNTKDMSLQYEIGYTQYTFMYNLSFGLLVLFGILFILLVDIKKIHNVVFIAILVSGIFISILNPVLDTPDDHAHLCRSELTSRCILFINGSTEDYNISNSVGDIINDNYVPINQSSVYHKKMDFSYESNYANYANTNTFIGYIPQALGILVAKLFGKIFGLSAVFILIFGRLFNLAFYASIVRVAVKKAPIFKIPLAIAAISPMALFIANSFNPDTTTYALVFLLIGYTLNLYKRENIEIKDMVIYSILCVLIGLVKLPYSIIGGLIIFLPKSKFKDKKMYYKSYIFVATIAIVCVAWGAFAMLNSSADSPFNDFYIKNNIDVNKQIKFILNEPKYFIQNFTVALVSNFKAYVEQLGTFGWLSYSVNPGIMMLYPIFIGSMIVFYPNEEIIQRKTKVGFAIVTAAIYVATCFILFLTWTPVSAKGIDGVQGRYFVPLIGMLMLLSCGKNTSKEEKEKMDYTFFVLAMLFAIVLIITIMNKYY